MKNINKLSGTKIMDDLIESRLIAQSENRLAKALSWRLNAFRREPNIMNLVRPIPTRIGGTSGNLESSTKISRKKYAQYRFRWGNAFYDQPIRDNVVFYESFSGNGALCNPLQVFRYLLSDPSMQHLEHVWSIRDDDQRRLFNMEYARYRNVRAVSTETDVYWEEISTAKYLLNNATFPPYFTKRPGQIYINLWHGTPLKKMGYHSNEGATGARNILRNFVQADYLVSPNRFTTEVMYFDAYKLREIFEGKIIEQGYPRVDAQFLTTESESALTDALLESGISLSGKPVVLYAPTWKGESFHRPDNDVKELLQRVNYLREQTGDSYQILLKVHQQVYSYAKNLPEFTGVLVSNDIPTNDILGKSSILITDYSSIYFDYLATGNPIIFLTPDFANYGGLRGLYHDKVPGPMVSNIEDVSKLLSEFASAPESSTLDDFKASRITAAREFSSMEDGNATKRLVDIVFKDNPDSLPLLSAPGTKKEKILLYLGGMRNNGITTSALNLLNNLDFSRFDVSIWAPQPSKDSPAFLYERIPSEIRQFLRQGTHPLSEDRHDHLSKFLSTPQFDDAKLPEKVESVFQAEWRRSFGQSRFDYIIDFSGYAGFWSFILLQGNASVSYSVWQHNDLMSDRDREVNGKLPNFDPLSSQFNAYRFFDNLVSVSQDLCALNARNLSNYTHKKAFKACHNTIDAKKVKDALSGGMTELPKHDGSTPQHLEEIFDLMLESKSATQIQELVSERALHKRIFQSAHVTRFVTAGRMSPEKNHARLLQAFSIVHAKKPDTELVLLGDGALRPDLEKLAIELGINDAVVFAGMVKNALPIMRDCDCFVLSSDYEGQPMVILEASSLSIPVVTVAFASVKNSLDSTRGIVVEQDAVSLANGMIDFIEGRVVTDVDFDVDQYNATAMREFYDAIGAK